MFKFQPVIFRGFFVDLPLLVYRSHGKREDESWMSLLADDVHVEGPKYVAIAGERERPYEV